MTDLKILKQQDSELYDSLYKELNRQRQNIVLIASENYVSSAVLAVSGSFLTNKYAEGYSGKRFYGGCQHVDVAEELAISRAKKLFNCEHVNVQPHSGANANFAVFFAMLKPGDTVLGMNLTDGGHLTHGSPANISGKYFKVVPYGVSKEDETINYDELEELAVKSKPKIIVAGASAYPRILDFKRFREIADKAGAYLMADIAHIAGLVVAGVHPSPVPYADFVTTTTHKTLRGPRGGMIMCKEQYAKLIDKAIFPGTQGGPLMHVIAAKAVAFKEAAAPEFIEYGKQIVKNANVMAKQFMKNGIKLVSNGTDNHLMLLNLSDKGMTGKELEKLLDECNITLNKNTIPFETLSPFITSGVRIGTPSVTTRGMKEKEMILIADLITKVINEKQSSKGFVKDKVIALCEKFPLYKNDIIE